MNNNIVPTYDEAGNEEGSLIMGTNWRGEPELIGFKKKLTDLEERCNRAVEIINAQGEFSVELDRDVCPVNFNISGMDRFSIYIVPRETPEEGIDGEVIWLPSWQLWIDDENKGTMPLPAICLAIARYLRDLRHENEAEAYWQKYANT